MITADSAQSFSENSPNNRMASAGARAVRGNDSTGSHLLRSSENLRPACRSTPCVACLPACKRKAQNAHVAVDAMDQNVADRSTSTNAEKYVCGRLASRTIATKRRHSTVSPPAVAIAKSSARQTDVHIRQVDGHETFSSART
jgi:hypothetical protein